MGLLDKLKNVFFEEEEIEVEEKPKKEKPLVKKIETPKKEAKEAKREVKIETLDVEEDISLGHDPVVGNSDLLRRDADSEFKFPILLEDEEEEVSSDVDLHEEIKEENMYIESKRENNIYGVDEASRVEIHYESDYHNEPYSNSYTRDFNSASYSLVDRKEVKAFKPSPVISPVYGVLDKNYTSDEIKEKNNNERKESPIFSFSSTKLDLDEVRAKAYGLPTEVTDEVANEIEEDIDSYDEVEASDTIDMTDTEIKPIVDSVTVGDAEEYFEDLGLEYNVDYKDSKKKTRLKRKSRVEETTDVEIDENSLEDVITDKPKKRRSRDKDEDDVDVEIEDNLFDLIDSMYDEGE